MSLNIVAIPCYNEEKTIGSVVLAAKKYAEVIVVNDGSTDRSAELAQLAGAWVINNPRNRGYGAAIQTALKEARNRKADVLVTLDGDGQHNPEDIPRFIAALDNADMVIGSRSSGTVPLYRRLGQKVLDLATRSAGIDSQNGYRAYSSKALAVLFPVENGMAISSEIIMQAKEHRLTITQLSVSISYENKAKRSPIGHGVDVLRRILAIVSLDHSLLVIGLPSLILLAGGLYSGSDVLSFYYSTKELQIGHALVTIMLVVLGLQGTLTALVLWAIRELLTRRDTSDRN